MSAEQVLIVGQGYVGLPLAMRAVEVGFDVIGLDLDERKVKLLSAGESYIEDITDERLKAALDTGRYRATDSIDDVDRFDVAIISVPTPLKEGVPDLEFMEDAARQLAPKVTKGSTIVLKSTTYPGTTEELIAPILEEGSGLQAGPDFPPRLLPRAHRPGQPDLDAREHPEGRLRHRRRLTRRRAGLLRPDRRDDGASLIPQGGRAHQAAREHVPPRQHRAHQRIGDVRPRPRHRRARAEKVVVFGAGEGGEQVIRAMMRNRGGIYYPVALVDDDRDKAGYRISTVRVEGTLKAVPAMAAAHEAQALVVAIPSAPPEVLRRAATVADEAGLRLLTLPPVDQIRSTGSVSSAAILDDTVRVGDIQPVAEEGLLGRGHIETDIDGIASYLADKRVLITGAGGSIGSELCRQIHRFGPAELIMLDRDESLLHAVQLSIDGRGQLESRALVVADIRDRERMVDVFDEWKPEVVFHAAALKHVPLLEMYPEEGHKTNVVGTQNLLDRGADSRVERFVNVSTDKAADPVNVLGRTKREAERLTAAMADGTKGADMSVRFGNVLGSRGSVLTAFREQIAQGGPVTVTHPAVTRYFMTVSEAVQLVIQAGAIGQDGEVPILDMGEPVKIADVAKRMVASAPGDIEIIYTGLRDGEKMHEVLMDENESGRPGPHPLITHVKADAHMDGI